MVTTGYRFGRRLSVLTFASVLFFTMASSAVGQSAPVGNSLQVFPYPTGKGAVRWVDLAYDPIDNVYLAVFGDRAGGRIIAQFLNAVGAPVGNPFGITNGGLYAQAPRVAFSADRPGFLVTWHSSETPTVAAVRGQFVSYPNSAAPGLGFLISPTSYTTFWEQAPALAYATGSKKFLVTWAFFGPGGKDIAGKFVTNAGVVGDHIRITNTAADNEREPGVGYIPDVDKFYVVYAGYNEGGAYSFVRALFYNASDGAPGTTVQLATAAATYTPEMTYNSATRQLLVAWNQSDGASTFRPFAMTIKADGSAATPITRLAANFGSYDALSVAYNVRTGTFFFATHGRSVDDAGGELSASGVPLTAGFGLTNAGGTGAFNPRLASSTAEPTWVLATARSYDSIWTHVIAGPAANPAPTPTPTPTPTPNPTPTPTPGGGNPTMSNDAPGNGAVVASSFTIAGWAADLGAPGGTGVDSIHVWAYPNPGSGAAAVLLGIAAYGGVRPDVGQAFGTRFTNSGYSLTINGLAPATYQVVVFAHSTVTGTFSNSKTFTITVIGTPRMSIDTPGNATAVGQMFDVAGWAIDTAAASGTGVDVLHIYAYPNPGSGQAPLYLGNAFYAGARPDIGTLYGAQFTNSGYSLRITGLAAGAYDIVVYARSTVTGTFNNAQGVRVTVQ